MFLSNKEAARGSAQRTDGSAKIRVRYLDRPTPFHRTNKKDNGRPTGRTEGSEAEPRIDYLISIPFSSQDPSEGKNWLGAAVWLRRKNEKKSSGFGK